MSNTVLLTPLYKTASRYFVEHVDYLYMLGTPLKSCLFTAPYVGNSKIIGTLRVTGTLASRRVSLLERTTLIHIKSVLSDAITGEFEFTNLSTEHEYIVIADDNEQVYNAAIADWVQVDGD